jgi:lysophospholipase L1-like esterase
MNPATIALAIALLFVGAGFAIAATKPHPLLIPGDKIWLIGDSLGVGLLQPLGEIVLAHNFVLSGAPVGGTTIGYWDAHPVELVEQWGATVVIVVLGTNDAAATERYRDTVPAKAAHLVSRLHAVGTRVCWVGPGSDFKFSDGGREVQTMIASSSGSELVLDPTAQKFQKQPDNVHPTTSGYAEMAKWIWNRLSGS